MGDGASLLPARPERLRWLEPAPCLRDAPGDLRARLEQIVARGSASEVYAALRRSLHRAEDPELGSIAIKELRNPSLPRQLWFGWLAEHPGVREYRAGIAFAARGGRTLTSLGAALERSRFGLARVLLFSRWLHGSVTLTRWLAEQGDPEPRLLAVLAAQIAAAARLGLVHHRHSSNNLLVVMQHGEPVLYTIDFPHATLGAALDSAGLAGDVARIARWILHEQLLVARNVRLLRNGREPRCAEQTPSGDDFARASARELEAVTRNPSARREARRMMDARRAPAPALPPELAAHARAPDRHARCGATWLGRFVPEKQVRLDRRSESARCKRLTLPDAWTAAQLARSLERFRSHPRVPALLAQSANELLLECVEGPPDRRAARRSHLRPARRFLRRALRAGPPGDRATRRRLRAGTPARSRLSRPRRRARTPRPCRSSREPPRRSLPTQVYRATTTSIRSPATSWMTPAGRLFAIDVEDPLPDQLLGSGVAKAVLRTPGARRERLLAGIRRSAGLDLAPVMPFVELSFLAAWTKRALLKGRAKPREPELFDRSARREQARASRSAASGPASAGARSHAPPASRSTLPFWIR